jgi:hypothetical protein
VEKFLNNANITILAKAFNPLILSQDSFKEILGAEELTNFINTPAVSVIEYANKIQVILDQRRFVINDTSGKNPKTSEIPRLARLFLDTNRGVPLEAIGTNFTVILRLPQRNGKEALEERFFTMSKNIFTEQGYELEGVGSKVFFFMDQRRCTLLLEPYFKSELKDIYANINIHKDISKAEEALEVIDGFEKDYMVFANTIDQLFQ